MTSFVINDYRKIVPLTAYLIILVAGGCAKSKQEGSFNSWYRKHYEAAAGDPGSPSPVHTMLLNSAPLHIDTIYRSMQGPYRIEEFEIEDNDELIWVTAYRSEIVDAHTEKEASPGFMCHNNLDIKDKSSFPWKVRTQGTSIRLFTLSEGQTSVRFPEGFGLPVPGDQTLSMFSQVLNHNIEDPDFLVKHKVELEYIRQSELSSPLRPLYSQVIFVTKQLEKAADTAPQGAHCGINIDSNAAYNPYLDQYGNTYTGHWEIPSEEEILTTEVSRMLDLPFDTRIHYIGVHLHPFAVSLSLYDLTTDSVLFTASAENYEQEIGLRKISSYASEEGVPVYRSHRYALKSVYLNTDSVNRHTAMATMLLYLEDR